MAASRGLQNMPDITRRVIRFSFVAALIGLGPLLSIIGCSFPPSPPSIDTTHLEPKKRLRIDTSLQDFAVSSDGRSAFVIGRSGCHYVDLTMGTTEVLVKRSDNDIHPSCVAIAPDSKTFAIGYSNFRAKGHVEIWEVATRKKLSVAEIAKSAAKIIFDPSGQYVYAGSYDGLERLDVKNNKVERIHLPLASGESIGQYRPTVCCLAISPDGATLAVGMEIDGGLVVWDVKGRKERFSRWKGKVPIVSIAISPDGKYCATYCDVCSLSSGEQIALHRYVSGGLSFSADGALLAAGRNSGAHCKSHAVVWRTSDLSKPAIFECHSSTMNGASFLGDTKNLATISDDGTLCVWDLSTIWPSEDAKRPTAESR